MRQTPIGGGHWLDEAPAAGYLRCRAAGMPAGITSAGRDWDEQLRLYEGYKAGLPGFNFALHPSQSNHCKGLALDLPGNVNDPTTPKGWMRKHGREWGWTPDANEDWHFDYNAALDQHKEDLTMADIDDLKARIGRLEDQNKTILGMLRGESTSVLSWLKARVGGSAKNATLSDALRGVDADVDIEALAARLTATLGESVAKSLAQKLGA